MSAVSNVFLMRYKEIKEGIAVFNSDGDYVGHSRQAGLKAVRQTALARFLLPLPTLLLPALGIFAIGSQGLLPRGRY